MNKHSLRCVLVVVALLTLGVSTALPHQTAAAPLPPSGARGVNSSSPLGTRFPISMISNAATHMAESNPSVAYGSAVTHWYLVVWDQMNSNGTGSTVYGQFVERNGRLNGSRGTFSPETGYNQFPDVAYDPVHDRFLVVYERGGVGIYGRIVTNAGTPGPEFQVVGATSGTPHQPAVAYCPASGKYLVTWQVVGGSSSGIAARAVNHDGTLEAGPPLEITGMLPVVEPSNPDVAYDAARDQFLIVWQQWASAADTTQHDIRGQQVSTTGSAHLVGPNVPIFDSTDDEVEPAVAGLNPSPPTIDGYLVVAMRWYDASYIDGWTVDGSNSERAQPLLISPYPGYLPAVAANDDTDQYLVVWKHDNSTLAGCTIPGDVTMDWSFGQLSGVFLSRPAIAAGPLQDYLVAYEDMLTSEYPRDIFGWLWGNRAFIPLVLRGQ